MPRVLGGSRRYRRGGPGTRGLYPYQPSQAAEPANQSQMDQPSTHNDDPSSQLHQELDAILKESTHAIFHKKPWKRHYKRLQKFHHKHGHTRVPLFQRRGDTLGMWLELQRQRYQRFGRKAFHKKKYFQKLHALLGAEGWYTTTTTTPPEEDDVFEWKEEHPLPLRQRRRIRIEDFQYSSDDSVSPQQRKPKRKTSSNLCDQSTTTTEPCSSTITSDNNNNNIPSTFVFDQELEINLDDDASIWSYAEDSADTKLEERRDSGHSLEDDPIRPRAESTISFGFDPSMFITMGESRNDLDQPMALPVSTTPIIQTKKRTDSLAWAKGFWKDPSTLQDCLQTKPMLADSTMDASTIHTTQPDEDIPANDWL